LDEVKQVLLWWVLCEIISAIEVGAGRSVKDLSIRDVILEGRNLNIDRTFIVEESELSYQLLKVGLIRN